MVQRGIVKSIEGGIASVEVGGGDGCSACNARESCVSITGKRPEPKLIKVENVLNAAVGDAVEVELPVKVTMRIITVTFLLPVALLIAGYWIMMPGGSTQAAVGAAGGLVAGMAAALAANRSMSRRKDYSMRMTDIVAGSCAAPSKSNEGFNSANS